MNGMRKVLGFLMAALLTAFAMPGLAAPAKIFGLDMSPSTVTTATVSLTAKYSNLTPNGNSVINTVILTPPANVTITGTSFPNSGNKVTCPATTVNSLGQTVPVPPNSICVSGIPSLMKAGCSPVACSWSFNVSATLPDACSVNTWTGQAFAGNSFNGDVFDFKAANSSVTTTIGTQCPHKITASSGSGGSIAPPGVTTVAWDGGQTYTIAANSGFYISDVKVDGASVGAVASYPFTMVEADHTIAATFAAKSLAITSAPSSAVVDVPFIVVVGETPGGPTPTMSSDCGATETHVSTPTSTTFTITAPNPGSCNITFSVPGYTDAQLPNFKVYKGQLDCNGFDSSFGSSDPTLDPDLDKSYIIPGGSGWGLRRGPNRDGSCNVKVNYTCDLDATTNIASCSWDKLSGEQATFKYVFVWKAVSPDSSGWKDFRPLISWGIPNPGPAVGPPTGYNWMPALACIDDLFPALPTLPTTILPTIPAEAPWTDAGNTSGQYVPGTTAWVCVSQQGSTSSGAPSGPVFLQFWHKVIDEADVLVKGPSN